MALRRGAIGLTDNVVPAADEPSADETPLPLPPRREQTEQIRQRLNDALSAFVEPVDTSVLAKPPQPQPLCKILAGRAEQWARLITSERDLELRDLILGMVTDAVGLSSMETEQSKEQEQEKEAEQEQEREVEMERYVDLAFLRDGEEPTRWAFCTLAQRGGGAASSDGGGGNGSSDTMPTPLHNGTFYTASQFRLHSRISLPFPPYLLCSRNYFDLGLRGERRLKNAMMVLEWVPSASQLTPLPTGATPLCEAQQTRLQSALRLLDLDSSGSFERGELREALRSAEDLQLSEGELDELLDEAGVEAGVEGHAGKAPRVLSHDALHDVLTSGRYRRADDGRYFVLLSLAEAQTIRMIMHMRQGRPLIDGSDVALALRCLPAGDAVFDASENFPSPPRYQVCEWQRSRSHVCLQIQCASRSILRLTDPSY